MNICPLNGQVCNEDKNHYVNEIYTGTTFSQTCLCKKCAMSFFVAPLATDVVPKCPSCNTSKDEAIQAGKLGCSNCLKTFGNDILVHLKVDGKPLIVQKAANQRTDTLTSISDKFQEQLCDCLTEEKYEDAAVLRDKLKIVCKVQEEIKNSTDDLTTAIEKEEYEAAKEIHLSMLALVDETIKCMN